MPTPQSHRLRIPSHYYVYCDPPDKDGDEVLHFVSAHRRLKLKGRSFREFVQHVVPLLDGRYSLSEIHPRVKDWFDEPDLAECFDLLTQNAVLEDVSNWTLDEATQQRLRPQLNLFFDLSPEPWAVQEKLAQARVTIFGLSGAGIAAARSLVAAGLGNLQCVDDSTVESSDLYFSPEFKPADRGSSRCDVLGRHLEAEGSPVRYAAVKESPDEAAIESIVAGSDFVMNCVDEGNISLVYKLNRVCLRTNTPWISAAHSGLEVVVGPTVFPNDTACYLCFRMRAVACASDPVASFDFESFLDRRKRDDSGLHASVVFGAAIAGQIAGTEALKAICGIGSLATRGKVQVFDLRDFSSTLHIVLRKPWCPACLAHWDQGENA